jgi:phage shock protein C
MPRDYDVLTHQQRRARRPSATLTPLRRSRQRFVGGVAGGIAKFIGASPLGIRVLFVLALFLTMGILGIVYILLWLFLPQE